MVKLSILTFYYRVFITPVFRRVVLATITFIALWVLTITIVLGLECRPTAKFWDPTIPGDCFNLVAVSYFTNISNLVTDLWIFFLPIPVIWRLQISRNRKLGLCGVFLIGLGCVFSQHIYHVLGNFTISKFIALSAVLIRQYRTCIISSVRVHVVVAQGSDDFMCKLSSQYTHDVDFRNANCMSGDGVPLGIMSAFEPLGGILSANLPLTYVLFANYFRKIKSTFSGSGQSKPLAGLSDSYSRRSGKRQNSDDQWIQLNPQASWSMDTKPLAVTEQKVQSTTSVA